MPLAIQVTFCLFSTCGRSLCITKTQYQCTAFHVLNASASTLAKQVYPWTTTSRTLPGSKERRPRILCSCSERRPRILCSCSACILVLLSGSIQGHDDGHPQPHPDSLHAGVLSYPAPTGPTQQGQGYFARTYAALLA